MPAPQRIFAAPLLALLIGPALPAHAQRVAPAELVAAARAVTREVAAIRQLPVRRPVDFRVSDRATVQEFARRSLEREMPPERWAAYDLLLTHVGLIGDDVDLHGLVLELYTEQIAGYYDPARKTFYLADWLPRLLQRAVVAHEVTHALQDQHFDLARWLSELPPTEDGALARAAVAEGDAMATMLAYLLVPAGMDVEDLPGVAALLQGQGAAIAQAYPTFDRAPRALQRLLLFPYVEGSDFVLTALKAGGWAAVDRLYRDSPASTEQILHPERYWDERDDPRDVPAPIGPADAETLIDGAWGEFGVALVLEAGLGDSLAAREAAAGWDGDRFALFRRRGGRVAYAWSLVWDDPASAERFAEAYAQATVRRFPGPARITTGAGRFVFESPARRLVLERAGDRVEIRENLPGPGLVGSP